MTLFRDLYLFGINSQRRIVTAYSYLLTYLLTCATGNDDEKAAASAACQPQAQAQSQVRAGHVSKGYHRLQQDDTLQQTSDSDRASRSGSASDELELDSDISTQQL